MRYAILLIPIFLLISCFDKLPFLKANNASQASHDTIAIQSGFYILAQRFQCVNVKLDVGSTEEHCANLSLISQKTNVDWLNTFLDNLTLSILIETKSSEQGIEQLVQKWFNDVLPELELNQSWDYSREIHFIGQREQLATFSVITSYYTGGAHGMYDTQFLNIDLTNKQIYTLDDILVSSDKRYQLIELLREANLARLKTLGISDFSMHDELELTDNFVFTINGLTFRYPVYTLGSYTDGEIDLVLPYRQLKDIIKPELLY
ncbi:TPA: DUF3298 domain-containing protein [Pasteurella multocida]|nr:DUF3298 domain-containing protein [Pasteurella multocida]